MRQISTNLTRKGIGIMISKELKFTREFSYALVDNILHLMGETLKKKGRLKLTHFGTFHIRQKSARPGRNPKTNEDVIITPRKVVLFRPSNIFKEKVLKRNKGIL